MSPPPDRRYLPTHEWHKLDGELITLGITQFAADELTDITFVELPKVGDSLAAGARFGEVESVKATSDLYTGLAGTVAAINSELTASPGLINADPYDRGWIIRLRPTNPADLNKLLPVEEYLKKIGH
jgi:glycine cleavage system H protein